MPAERPGQGDESVPGRRTWAGAALLLAGVLAVVLVWPSGGGLLGGPPTVEPPAPGVQVPTTTADPSVVRSQELDLLLGTRADAVLERDREAWLGTVDPASAHFYERQAAVFDNLADVPIASWHYELAGEGPALPADRTAELGPDAWVARTVLVYRLSGAEDGEVRREQQITLVRRDGRWLVHDDRDGRTARELWDLGPVHVARGERSLVLGTAEPETLDRYVAETDRAAEQVDEVWGTAWPRTVVVMVPRSQEEMAELLQRDDEDGLEQIAAVTTGELETALTDASLERVVVNPAGFAQLGTIGRRVVLAHEITHVATRATSTTTLPIWLSEGFADHVAYRGTDVSREVVASDVLELVRQGQGPRRLPDRDGFDPRAGDVAPAYSGAWLAADLIARRWGEDALVDLYRAVAGGETVDSALSRVLGTDEEGLTASWRAYLEELAA